MSGLSAQEVRWLTVICERLVPPGPEGPSASEAHVVEFIVGQLEGPWGQGVLMYRQGPFLEPEDDGHGWQSPLTPAQAYGYGLDALDRHAREQLGHALEELSEKQQDEVITAWSERRVSTFTDIDATAFFEMVRQNVVEGLLGDPRYGGNHDMVGWRWLGYPGVADAHGGDYAEHIDRHGQDYSTDPRPLGWATE
jgi:gluconate 2-dehydrogenase gamma chain